MITNNYSINLVGLQNYNQNGERLKRIRCGFGSHSLFFFIVRHVLTLLHNNELFDRHHFYQGFDVLYQMPSDIQEVFAFLARPIIIKSKHFRHHKLRDTFHAHKGTDHSSDNACIRAHIPAQFNCFFKSYLVETVKIIKVTLGLQKPKESKNKSMLHMFLLIVYVIKALQNAADVLFVLLSHGITNFIREILGLI